MIESSSIHHCSRGPMKPSTLLKTFSSKLSSRSSVAPWPPIRTQFDLWLTTELDHLRIHPGLYTTTAWLSKSLDTAISAQEMATDSIKQDEHVKSGTTFESYLDDTVYLLDACNAVRQRIDDVRAYASSVSIALHCLEGLHVHKPSDFAISRARALLDSCTVAEKRCTDSDKRGSSLRKMGDRLASAQAHGGGSHEIMIGSRAVALLTIAMATVSLSLQSRWGVPTVHSPSSYSSSSGNCWGSSILEMQREAKAVFEKRRRDGGVVLEELRIAISTTRRLRSLIDRKVEGGGEVRDLVRELRRRLEELEEGVGPLEEGVGRLYRGLVDVRMCLLRKISDA